MKTEFKNLRPLRTNALLLASLMLGSLGGCSTARAQDNPIKLPPRIRSISIHPKSITPEIVQRAVDFGVNFIICNIKPDPGTKEVPTEQNPLLPYKKAIENLRRIFPTCHKNNLKIAVGVVPWGRKQDIFWTSEEGGTYRDHLPKFWKAFATEFKDEPAIVAYDIMSEPNFPEGRYDVWQKDLLPRSIAEIRKVNPNIWLFVQPGPWGMPGGFAQLEPIDDPYVVYNFHPYAPHGYLHQGIREKKLKENPAYAPNQTYPGMLQMFNGTPRIHWDKEQLKKFMKPAYDFSRKHNVRMLAGEFGVVRWAPGREKWMADMIEIFEEWGFDWSTFSLGGWNGWNHTFGPNDRPSQESFGNTETEILKIWKAGWAKNWE